MRQVQDSFQLSPALGDVSLWANSVAQELSRQFQEYGYRLNRVAPLDGSEAFTSEVEFEDGINVSGGDVTLPATSISDGALSANVALYDGDMNQFTVGTLADARLSSNVALLDQTNTFTGGTGFTSSDAAIVISSAEPNIIINQTDANADEGIYLFRASGPQFQMHVRNDAEDSGNVFFRATRSGTAVSEIELNASTIDLNGDVECFSIESNHEYSGGVFSINLIANTFPGIKLQDTNASSTEQTWAMYITASSFILEPRTDTGGSSGNGRIQLVRSGVTVSEIRIDGDLIRLRDSGGNEAARVDGNSGAGNTRLLVYDVDNATLERVSVGAAGSGGSGFKVLRIPN